MSRISKAHMFFRPTRRAAVVFPGQRARIVRQEGRVPRWLGAALDREEQQQQKKKSER